MNEFGASEQWETEIVATLQEGRGAVFGGAAGENALGSTIVGATLSRIKDPEARELFNALSVAPEDVPVPMAALELIWCSHKTIAHPLGKLAMMRLRTRAFVQCLA